ncbi:MAG: methyltransferase domain-containing protein [Chitinophagaceae bacterium]|nr:methyltransferase domain-containing protein [Chitinophagaceae bacterium]
MNNYFDTKSIADRYQKGRPYVHFDTILSIKNYLGLTEKLSKVLDVACGTGLSTKALLEIAEQIEATDISAEMLANAYKHEHINYTQAKAEEQLFAPDTFDMITVSSGVHWFDIDRFLAEANRVLKQDRWLVIYDSFFSGKMAGVNVFNDWYPLIYGTKFPPPARNNSYDWSNKNLSNTNFAFLGEQQLGNDVTFSLDQLVLYLTTQSNITAQVEQGVITYNEAETWLYQQLRPFFVAGERKLHFGGWTKFLKKKAH